MAIVEDSMDELIDVVGWLCRAMRMPSTDDRVNFSSSCYTMQTHTVFDAETPLVALRDEPLWNMPYNCWQKLFGFCTVVAPPEVTKLWMPKAQHRNGGAFGRGLEMSFDLMVALAAVEFPLIINDGIVFVGYDAILVPTAVSTSGDAAQFHLITINDKTTSDSKTTSGQLNPYAIDLGPRLLTKDVQQFRNMRCFLGWCQFAQVNLGTRHLPAHVQYSGCKEKDRSLVRDGYESLLQIGLGGGPLSVVLGLQTNFRYTSHRPQFTPFGGFGKLLRDTAREVAAVYDAGNRRCWLVPKLSTLLHMAHAYALNCADGRATTVPFVEAHSDAAKLISVLEPLGDRPIHSVNSVATIRGPSPGATFLDGFVFRQLLLGLNTNLLSAVASTQRSSGRKLYGFEFMDVVTTPGRGPCMKATTLESMGRHWLDLVNGADAIIMCSNIGQIITPTAAVSRHRPECNDLPTGLDYLAAMVPCLDHLFRRRGGVLKISPANSNGNAPSPSSCRIKISEDSFWDLCGDPFRPCTHDMNSSEICWNRVDLLQRLVTVSFFTRDTLVAMARPGSTLSLVQTIPSAGAVIFG